MQNQYGCVGEGTDLAEELCGFGTYCIGDSIEFQLIYLPSDSYDLTDAEYSNSDFTSVFLFSWQGGSDIVTSLGSIPISYQITNNENLEISLFEFPTSLVGNFTEADYYEYIELIGTISVGPFPITVLPQQFVEFTANPYLVYQGEPVSFESVPISGSCSWILGVDDVVNGDCEFDYAFTTIGEQEVTLTVSNDGCSSNASVQIITVIDNMPEIILQSSTCFNELVSFLGICPNSSFVTSWLWDFGSGSTSNLQNPSNLFSATGVYTITLTTYGYNNTLIGTASIEIIVGETPESFNIIGNTMNCTDWSTYSVDNPNDALLYTWSFEGAESTLSYPDSIQIDWDNESVFLGNASLTLIATDPTSGCFSETSISILSCCNPNPDIVLLDGDTDLEATNQIGGDSLFLFKVISIEGTVYFNSEIIFQECQVYMGPNAKIIVDNNALFKIEKNSHVFACNGVDMWDRIEVRSGSRIEIENAIIEDGINAVFCNPGAKHFIRNTDFLNNYISIFFDGVSSTSYYFYRNVVEVNRNLYSPYELKDKGHIGVKIIKSNDIIIGDTSDINNENQFRNLDFGIFVEKSNLTLYNNLFEDITPDGESESHASMFSPNIIEPGRAVYTEGGLGGYYLKAGGTSHNMKNSFLNCTYGFDVFTKYDADIVGNDFELCSKCIQFSALKGNTVNIAHN